MSETADRGPRRERILLVDDDEDIQAIVHLALVALGGFEVLVCSSGAAAVGQAPGGCPDLILLDVQMPGMDGFQTLAGLRGLPQTTSTPVILLTASVQAEQLAQYRHLTILGVIPKPFNALTLTETIATLWKDAPR